jgi:hypothetical protein
LVKNNVEVDKICLLKKTWPLKKMFWLTIT